MTMVINRLEFLQKIQAVQPGLTPRDIVEQSSCLAFRSGLVQTFNDEVACSMPSGLEDTFTAAVPAAKFTKLLDMLPEETLEIVMSDDGVLSVKGKGRTATLRVEKEVTLPPGLVGAPEKWLKIHPDFSEAISIIQDTAGKDEARFALTCIRVHPKWIEATDGDQQARFMLPTGVEKPVLLRRESMKHLLPMDVTKFGETEAWIHFKNPIGLQMSFRRYFETYPDITPFFEIGKDAKSARLPKGIASAIEIAEIFSKDDAAHNRIRVKMKEGKMLINGEGTSGTYSEVKKVSYVGPPIEFWIAPGMLAEITKKSMECLITKEKLKIDAGRWVYVACLEQSATGE